MGQIRSKCTPALATLNVNLNVKIEIFGMHYPYLPYKFMSTGCTLTLFGLRSNTLNMKIWKLGQYDWYYILLFHLLFWHVSCRCQSKTSNCCYGMLLFIYSALLTLPMPHLVSISAVTLPTPPTPTTATAYDRIFCWGKVNWMHLTISHSTYVCPRFFFGPHRS